MKGFVGLRFRSRVNTKVLGIIAGLCATKAIVPSHCMQSSVKFEYNMPVEYQVTKPSFQNQQEMLEKWIENILAQLEFMKKLFYRFVYHLFNFLPSLASSPLLLLQFPELNAIWWDNFNQSILRAGPCSIKFAQWIATRPDLFPTSLCNHFRFLQSNNVVPSWKEIEPIFESSYGEHWKAKIKLRKDRQTGSPLVIGGGCVAQVLLGNIDDKANHIDDMPYAFKVTHPNVKNSIISDIELMKIFASWLEYLIPSMGQISLLDSVHEFSKSMLEQVDMVREAHNLEKFRYNFNADSHENDDEEIKWNFKSMFLNLIFEKSKNVVNFPEPIWEYTNHDILVETYERGELIRDYIENCSEKERKEIAKIGLDAIFKMVFIDNFVHADLHPGNIILNEQRNKNAKMRVSFIDAGLVASLSPLDLDNLVELFYAVIMKDGSTVGRLMIERSRYKGAVIDPQGFIQGISDIVEDATGNGLTLGKIGVSALLQKVLMLCFKHQVKLESRFANIILAMGVVEGLGRQLDPDLDIIQNAAPYVIRASLRKKSK